MQLPNQRLDVTTGGLGQTSAFKIQNSAKMFSILADKIYSDKQRAIVRELSANALDIHTQTGQTEPFLVLLPHTAEPTLIIRDFGTGLSEERILENYTTFFDSTKADDNSQVGAFGLGSKTPFSYCDMFTITSYQDGVKKVYTAFKGPNGIPTISKVGDEETDARNGLEIRVPVRNEDFHRFLVAATRTLKHFPEGSFRLVGANVDPQQYKWDWGWVAEIEHAVGVQIASTVKMGPIVYDVDWSTIPENIRDAVRYNMEFRVPLGAVDLSPSRESLSMDDMTIECISQLGARLMNEAVQMVFKQIDSKSNWITATKYNAIKDTTLAKLCGDSFKGAGTVEVPKGTTYTYSYEMERRTLKDTPIVSVGAKANTYVLVVDESKRISRRVNMVREQVGACDGLVIIRDVTATKFLDDIPADRVIKASDIELPAVIRSCGKRSEVPVVYMHNGSSMHQIHEDRAIQLLEEGGVYVPMKSSMIEPGFSQLMQANLYIDNRKVIGLTKRAQSLVDMDAFQRLDEFTKEKIEDLGDIGKLLADTRMRAKAADEFGPVIRFIGKVDAPVGDPFFDPAWRAVHDNNLYSPFYGSSDYNRVRRAIELGLIQEPTPVVVEDWAKPLEVLCKRRPLLQFICDKAHIKPEEVELVLKSLSAKG